MVTVTRVYVIAHACLLIPLTRPISRKKRVILEFIEAERLECDSPRSRGGGGGGTKNRYVNRFGIRRDSSQRLLR